MLRLYREFITFIFSEIFTKRIKYLIFHSIII